MRPRDFLFRPRWKLQGRAHSGHSEPMDKSRVCTHAPAQQEARRCSRRCPGCTSRRGGSSGIHPQLNECPSPAAGASVEELDEVIGAEVEELVQVHPAEGELAEGALLRRLLLVSLHSRGANAAVVSARAKQALKHLQWTALTRLRHRKAAPKHAAGLYATHHVGGCRYKRATREPLLSFAPQRDFRVSGNSAGLPRKRKQPAPRASRRTALGRDQRATMMR